MMKHSPLRGRRIHVSGSVPKELEIASTENVNYARTLLAETVLQLMKRGATFVVPIDAEKMREADGIPICFDWLILKTIADNLSIAPDSKSPLVVAVLHHKNESQVPEEYRPTWDKMRRSPHVKIESAAHWNMAAKRMEMQARWGDILLTIGGTEGVLFLANLYHDAGKPIIPINIPLCAPNTGTSKLFEFGQNAFNARKLFRTAGVVDSLTWLNRIDFRSTGGVMERVQDIVDLLEDIERPRAFAVRLLNPDFPQFEAVQEFFDVVVRPVLEDELGYSLTVIDGKQKYEHSRIDQEIFEKLHRSSVVIADITADRPNCYLELGYAFGRGLRTLVTAMEGEKRPFDITTFAGLNWKKDGTVDERREKFREHWQAILTRPPLVGVDSLIM